jgi:type II secretory pathway pseudopilin PulG
VADAPPKAQELIMTTDPTHRRGHSLTELLVLLLIVTALLAMALPSLASLRGGSHLQQSMGNLMTLHSAHVTYAADHNWNQFGTWPHSLSVYGKNQTEALTNWAQVQKVPYQSVAKVYLGWNKCGHWHFTTIGVLAYGMFMPISFESPSFGWGLFRHSNVEAFHQYVEGRFYGETYYAPGDWPVWDLVETLFPIPGGFHNPETDQCGVGTNVIWPSSYITSPAALYHPHVMRAPSAGGWQNPWLLPYSFVTPPLHAATYPDLKTHILEHHWIQNAPKNPCHPDFDGQGGYAGCQPYLFNASIDSAPVTLFYDGHIRLLPNTEVQAWDEMLFEQNGDGLWHRQTPLAQWVFEHYFHALRHDDIVNLSHHVLTIDGILGRDTLGPDGGAVARFKHGVKSRAALSRYVASPHRGPLPPPLPGGAFLAEPEP